MKPRLILRYVQQCADGFVQKVIYKLLKPSLPIIPVVVVAVNIPYILHVACELET